MNEPAETQAAEQEKPAAGDSVQPGVANTEGPKVPPAQDGDPQVAKAVAVPVPDLPTEEEARKELDANPARNSVLSKVGYVVRE